MTDTKETRALTIVTNRFKEAVATDCFHIDITQDELSVIKLTLESHAKKDRVMDLMFTAYIEMPKLCAYNDEYGDDFDFERYHDDMCSWSVCASQIIKEHKKLKEMK